MDPPPRRCRGTMTARSSLEFLSQRPTRLPPSPSSLMTRSRSSPSEARWLAEITLIRGLLALRTHLALTVTVKRISIRTRNGKVGRKYYLMPSPISVKKNYWISDCKLC
ncbi:unnamed protein product [Urochloa humidicola]